MNLLVFAFVALTSLINANKEDLSPWNQYLVDNIDLVDINNSFFNATDEETYESLYSEEFVIGLLANIQREADEGVVEYSFSAGHAYGFYLPSGGCVIRTRADIDYLYNWPISGEKAENERVAPGTCGVSCLQWSGGRRLTYLRILKDVIGDKKTVDTLDFSEANVEMLLKELKPGSYYYNQIMDHLPDNPTAEDYAEAMCDYYVKPMYADLNMSGTGLACKDRRALASDLWELYKGKESYANVKPEKLEYELR